MNEQLRGLVLKQRQAWDAPTERVFLLMTQPAELVKWWGPHGFTTPVIELDLKVGGRPPVAF